MVGALLRSCTDATCCGFRAAVGDAPDAELPIDKAAAMILDPKMDKAKVAAVNRNRVAI